MLFPTDPAARPGLMAETLDFLSSKPQIVVVLNGRVCNAPIAKLPDGTLGTELCRQFEGAGVKRVGSSRGIAIGPVWAFDSLGDAAELKLCALPGSEGELLDPKRWANEVRAIVMNLEFEERKILELRFPMKLEGLNFQGWEKHELPNGSILRRG